MANPVIVPILPAASQPEVGPVSIDLHFCCIVHVLQVKEKLLSYLNPGVKVIISSECDCDRVLFGARCLAGTLNSSGCSLYFRNLVSNLHISVPYFSVLEVTVHCL